MASLYRWFSVEKPAYLPDPDVERTEDKASKVREANKAVFVQLIKNRKRPCSHHYYDPELRAKIGKFAATSGNKAAVEKFSKELRRPVGESTMHGMKKAYYIALKHKKDGEPVTRLEHRLRGRPLLLGDHDAHVQEYIRKLRLAGCIANRAIVIAAATGVVQHNNPAILSAHGGPLELKYFTIIIIMISC